MIFSTDKCPICNTSLEMEVVEMYNKNMRLNYFCTVKEIARNDEDSFAMSKSHYVNKCFGIGSVVYMILPPFELLHHEKVERTVVYEVSAHKPLKFIVDIPLLDVDYSEPYAVINRLKLLLTFS